MSVLPSNVSFFMQRLQGVSVSHFKVHPQGSDTASASKISRFELPSNSLLNFRNTRLFFNASTAGGIGRLPNDISSLIERVAIYIGGTLVQNNFQGYNLLCHAKAAIEGSKCNSVLGHPEIVRETSYHNGANFSASSESYTRQDEVFCIDAWEGLLGSIEPSILDSGLVGQITIEITWAENSVCPSIGGTALCDNIVTPGDGTVSKKNVTQCTFSVSNMSMQVEVLGMATSVLDQITEQRIASVGYLSLPFKNYYTYSSNHHGTSRFSVNSASWDRVWLVYRPISYSDTEGAHVVPGYKIAGAHIQGYGDIGKPQYDLGGVLDTNSEKYVSSYFQMKEPLTIPASGLPHPASYQLQVNGASIPAYKMTASEFYSVTKNSVDAYHVEKKLTMSQYKDSYFVQCMRFCLPDSSFSRLASGLDTRSVSAQAAIETQGLDQCNLTIYAECSAELRIGSGRAIEIIS